MLPRKRPLLALLLLLLLLSACVFVVVPWLASAPAFTAADLGLTHSEVADAPLDAAVSPLLFFLHVPKTAGQTFAAHLHACFQGSRNVSRAGVAATMSAGARVDLNFAQVADNIARFRRPGLMRDLFRSKLVAMGHCDTTVATMLDTSRPVLFLTVLRQPVARVKSLYFYLMTRLFSRTRRQQEFVRFVDALNGLQYAANSRGADDAPPAPEPELGPTSEWWTHVAKVTFNWTEPTSLVAFAAQLVRSHQDNYQTRALSGNLAFSFRNASSRVLAVDAAMLEAAKATLRAMPFFGLTEHFDASMALFRDTVGARFSPSRCQSSTMQSRNKTPPFRSRALSAHDGALARVEQFDVQLYQFAEQLFMFRCRRNDACAAELEN